MFSFSERRLWKVLHIRDTILMEEKSGPEVAEDYCQRIIVGGTGLEPVTPCV
jgi:hypothetical protein